MRIKRRKGLTMNSRRGGTGLKRRGGATRIAAAVLVVWLIIGAIAAGQRHYYSGSATNCAGVETVLVTILAGPLNYLGVNPKIHSCDVPTPSK
jgi:hypothetical protein